MQAATDIAASTAETATPGAVLAAERERQGLARGDVAQRVHMSVSQIEALESGDYGRLPRGTFLRGFVRNYARALGVDPEPVVRMLSESAPRDPRPGIVVKSQNIRFDPLGERLSSPFLKALAIATVIVIVGFFAMYYWLFIRPAPPAAHARKAVAAAMPAASAVLPAQAPATAPAPAPVSLPLAAPPPEPGPAAPAKESDGNPPKAREDDAARRVYASAVDPIPVLAAGGSILRFKFRGNSWVEIRDGRGKVLLSRINPGGSEAEVVGKPPFNIVVGNAPEVKMFYNEREFDLEPHTRVAVARLTVD